jgi:hypothetical protein
MSARSVYIGRPVREIEVRPLESPAPDGVPEEWPSEEPAPELEPEKVPAGERR